MTMRLILVCLCLTACNTPSMDFRGITATTVTVGPSTFDVRQNGDRVELIRTSPELVRNLRQIAPRAAAAVQLATGCALQASTLRGEATLMQGRIDCP